MSGSSATDFLSQISGLLFLTCISGTLWMVMMFMITRRARERRRRKELGLENLPSFYSTVMARSRTWMASGSASTPKPKIEVPSATLNDFVPTPDLSMLIGSSKSEPVVYRSEPEPPAAIPAEEYYRPVEENRNWTPEPQPEPSEPYHSPESDPDVPTVPPNDAIELLRVWRDVADGGLILEINGKRFRSMREVAGTDMDRRLNSVLRELNQIGRPPAPRPAAPSEPPVSMGPGTMFRQMGRVAMGQNAQSSDEKKPAAPMSIPDQIEELLQARLSEFPEYRLRSIHVRPSMSGGVRIEVDGRFYEGIGDVADPEVRSLLTDVVREWESRQ
jgi:hypothetical protein